MEKKIHYVKIDKEDILEILIEHFYDQFKDTDTANGIILGTPDGELRFIGAYSKVEDAQVCNIDLELVDKKMDYNGEHAFLKNNPQFYLNNLN